MIEGWTGRVLDRSGRRRKPVSGRSGRIATAAREAGRDPDLVGLVAVAKTHGAPAIEAALRAGQRLFGENRVQEALLKYPGLRAAWPDLRLHLIGPLQSNKVRDAVALFDVIETIDREKLAPRLAEEMRRTGRMLPCMIQVNIGDEPQKAGVDVAGLADLLTHCRAQDLPIVGLMCIPPAGADPKPYFARLRTLAHEHGLNQLSMGMSGDFPEAIAEGATLVRVGTAIFGSRPAVDAV